MAKKISRVLASNRDYILRPFALVNHTHEFYANTVADLTERDALEGENRYEGVIYYVKSDQTTYQLRGGTENTDWVVLVSAGGASSHLDLTNIGTNTHVQIDTHIADSTLHFTQASISITESQISDLQAYALASHDHDAEYLGISATAAAADALSTTGAVVDVSAAAPPVAGQILTATSPTAATWQNAAAAGIGDIIQTGSPVDTYVGYFSADKNLTGDAGFTWITAAARLNVIGATPEFRLQDNNNAAATMVAELSFWDSTAVTARIRMDGTGNLRIENTAGEIRFDTGTSDVVVSGNGDLSVGNNLDVVAYLTSYGGTPADGSTLQWNTGNARAEFTLGAVMNSGTPVDNQVALWTTANTIEGDPNFTWSGTILDIAGLGWDSTVDKLTLGNADLSVPGIEITGSATASPYLNLVQDGVVRAIFKYSNANTALEISSTADNIKLRPGNVDTYSLKTATMTAGNLVFNIDQTVGASEDGYLFVYDNTSGEISLTDTIPYLITGDPGLEGTGITIAGLSFDAVLKASNIGNGDSELILHKHSTTSAATLIGARTASDTNTHAAVADNDTLLNIAAVGWDGTDYQWGAGIKFRVDGTVAANDVPGEIVFQVDGLTEAMVLRSSGNLELTGALFTAGTFIFDTDQVVGVGVDNYVLTYDNSTGHISLEAAAGGGGVTELVNLSDVNTSTATDKNFLIADGVDWESRAAVLADISDVTATAAEVNLLDLAGLTAGWVLSADTATTASWKAPTGGGGSIGGSITDNQIAVGATTADDIEGSANFTWDGTSHILTSAATTQDVMTITANSLTTGRGLVVTSSSGTRDSNPLVEIIGAAGQLGSGLEIDHPATGAGLFITKGGLGEGIIVSHSGTGPAANLQGGELILAPGTANYPSLVIQEGVAPTVPTDGMVWVTAAGAFNVRLNGVTVDLAAGGGGGGIGGSIADNQIAVGATTADDIEGSGALTYNSATGSLIDFVNRNGTVSIGAGNTNTGTSARSNVRMYSDVASLDLYAMSSTYNGVAGWAAAAAISSSAGASGGLIINASAGGIKLQTNLTDAITIANSTQIATFAAKAIFPAATTAGASINMAHGAAPTTPVNGDIWTTTAGVFARVNGVTNQLDGGGGGTLVSKKVSQTQTATTGTTVLPFDATIPQNTEGDEKLTVSITPDDAANTLVITCSFFATHSSNNQWLSGALFQDTTADALASCSEFYAVATEGGMQTLIYTMAAGTTSSTTFKLRVGSGSSGTTTFNRSSATFTMGGKLTSIITVEEFT